MIEDSRSVNDLPSEVLVIHVSDEERSRGESVLVGISFPSERYSSPLTGCTSTSALVILFIKLLFPTFGYPQISKVRVFGSMAGNLPICCLTCSRYTKGSF